MSQGWFDETATPAGWFDETTSPEGWFDGGLLSAAPDVPTPSAGTNASYSRRGSFGVSSWTNQEQPTPNVSTGITGVSGSGEIGSLSASHAIAISGVSGSGAIGTLAVSTDKALSGVSGTGGFGSLSILTSGLRASYQRRGSQQILSWTNQEPPVTGVSVALDGVSGTGDVGAFTVSNALTLAGLSSTSAAGTVLPATSIGLVGVAGSGGIGTLTVDGVVTTHGVRVSYSRRGSISAETWTNQEPGTQSAALTGVSGTGSVGTFGVVRTVALTGVSGTGSVGTLTASVATNVTVGLTGVSGTGAVGTVSVLGAVHGISYDYSRRGSISAVTWTNQEPQSVNSAAALTGNAGSGAIGSFATSRTVALTGVSGTGFYGTLTPVISGIPVTVGLTGVAGLGEIGTLYVDGAPRGVKYDYSRRGSISAVTWTNQEPATGNVQVALSGVSGTGSVGSLGNERTVGLSGVAATGNVGSLIASTGPAFGVPLTGVSATGGVGTLGVNIVGPGVSAALTGVSGTGQVGTLTASVIAPGVVVGLTGVSASGEVGTLTQVGGTPVASGGMGFIKRKFGVRHGNKLLVFDSEEQADEYEKATSSALVAAKAIKKARRQAVRDVRVDFQPEVIDTQALQKLVTAYDLPFDLPTLISQQAIDEIVRIRLIAMEMQEEEDLLMLLL